MYARVTTIQIQKGREEELLEVLKETAIPLVEHQPGFCGYLRLTDSKTGKAMTITLWESEDAVQASSAHISEIRAITGPFYVMPPFQEVFEVSLQVSADGTIVGAPSSA